MGEGRLMKTSWWEGRLAKKGIMKKAGEDGADEDRLLRTGC
jgi:hypothetical protein